MKRYESVQDILKEFFELRLHYYKLRKDWLVGNLGAEAAKLSNQARFVLEKIEGKLTIGEMFQILRSFSPESSSEICFFSSLWLVNLNLYFNVTANNGLTAEDK